MTTADEYRSLAEECFRRACDAKTHEEKTAFLDMARNWTEMAAREACRPMTGSCAFKR